ncbi:MAG: mannose-1-phosphate guanylyltransferase/mannose-6-phosphate isomerase [Proteobacteria bacterium]|nr:mannose-1-phosphate guanylyltransferase/mannose-6-phosphate isomerase [Pseudomonadota bacterium]
MANGQIYPVILSGGAGTRLWPLSRELYPKQLLPLVSPHSLLQETARRVAKAPYAAPLIVCNEEHRFIIAEQLRQLAIKPRAIVLEPIARNTAPAAAAAAVMLAEADPQALMLVLPSDHVIADTAAFDRAVAAAAAAARQGRLVTFGITSTLPETGYGYIRRGAALDGLPGVFAVDRFVEKPDLKTAQGYLAEGKWSWNSGMFLFPAALFLDELIRLELSMVGAARIAVGAATRDLDFVRLSRDAFAGAPAKSIDVAVMERTKKAAVVPANLGWSDVGAWSALWEIGAKDAAGNVVIGDVMAEDTRNSYLRSDRGLLAAVGLDDVVVVATQDVVLAAAKDRVQDVRKIVEKLKLQKRSEAVSHPVVYRPWGSYQTIDLGPRFQVKRITVKPGAKLSLQKHAHRAEHWVVVSGTACVTCDDKLFTLQANASTYIPLGAVHRLENPGSEPLDVIEVQSGGYLGEDDIVRLEDSYGRK